MGFGLLLLLSIFVLPALLCPVMAYQLGLRLGRPALTIWVGICFLPVIPAIILAARLMSTAETDTQLDALMALFAGSFPTVACIPGLIMLERAKRPVPEDKQQLGFSPPHIQPGQTKEQTYVHKSAS